MEIQNEFYSINTNVSQSYCMFSVFIYSDGNCTDPLSNLHLRPSEQALVKIVNINMDKTKISEFIREQRMARH